METTTSFADLLLPMLLGQLPTMLIELAAAITVLVMLLRRGDTLGRARIPALTGVGMLIVLAIGSRLLFAALQAYSIGAGMGSREIAYAYAASGIFSQMLYAVAIVLLGVAIVRR